MGRIAVISDIHSNLEALEAVLADIQKQGISEIWCLGDIVGYGPDPVACLDIVIGLKEKGTLTAIVQGNHDWAVVNEPLGFNSHSASPIHWTKKELIKAAGQPKENKYYQFLKQLPSELDQDGFILVHGSPSDPLCEYIERKDFFEKRGVVEVTPNVERIFDCFDYVLLCGHTHYPIIAKRREDGTYALFCNSKLEDEPALEPKTIVNAGSVGQPRDGNSKAGYVILDTGDMSVNYRRVEYSPLVTHQKMMKRMGSIDPETLEFLSDRLLEGR